MSSSAVSVQPMGDRWWHCAPCLQPFSHLMAHKKGLILSCLQGQCGNITWQTLAHSTARLFALSPLSKPLICLEPIFVSNGRMARDLVATPLAAHNQQQAPPHYPSRHCQLVRLCVPCRHCSIHTANVICIRCQFCKRVTDRGH